MSYPVFPSELPCVSRIDGYGMTAATAVIKTPLDAGNSRQRRMHARLPQEISLAWRLSNTQLQPVFAWLNTYGYEWFSLNLAGLEASYNAVQSQQIIVRLMSDIQYTLMLIHRQNWWTLAVTAEYQPLIETLLPPPDLIPPPLTFGFGFGARALFIPLNRFTPAPEPPPRAFSSGFDKGFS